MLLGRLFETQPGDSGLPGPQRRLAVLTLIMGTLMAVLDSGIVNIALPTLAQEFEVAGSHAVWITNIYQLVCAASLLSFAALSHLVGRYRLYIGGLVVFTLASLGCALSRSLELLLLSRALQAIGAAAMLSIGPSLYRVIFPPRLLGSAIGLSTFVVAFGIAFGPSLGGGILYLASWPWLFAINVPIGVLALWLAWRALPREPARPGAFDWAGALLSAVMLGGFVLAIDRFGHGERGIIVMVPLVASGVCTGLFVWRQRRAPRPLVPLVMFEEPRFALAAAVSLLAFVAQGAAFVGLPFLYQTQMDLSPLQAAWLFTPWPLALMFSGPLAGRLADRVNPTLLSSLGLGIFLLGMLAFALMGTAATTFDIVWRATLCGLGYGLFQAPNNREMIGSVPLELSANASGILASVRTFGQSLGTALVGLVLALSFGSIALALWLGCGSVVLALLLSVRRIPLAAKR
ncbi:MFS transporter [Halomonas shantousis]